MKRRLVVLASGSGTNLQAVLDASAAGRLAADVVHVVSNRSGAGALTRARVAGVPATPLPRSEGESRSEYDTRLAALVDAAQPDLVVLAGWMRILTMKFVGRFPGRIVNVHPALPGELPGTDAVPRALAQFERGQRTSTGVMVHLVPDEGVDDGPVLATATVDIHAGDTVATLTERMHVAEHRVLVDTLERLCRRPAPLTNGAET